MDGGAVMSGHIGSLDALVGELTWKFEEVQSDVAQLRDGTHNTAQTCYSLRFVRDCVTLAER